MKGKQVTIKESQFAKVHARLKKFEKTNGAIKIGNKSLSNFLLAHADFTDDSSDSKAVRTKRRILHIAGDHTTNPATLQGTIRLKANLGYGSDEYSLLQLRLDRLVKEYISNASISTKEATDCEKVSDCVTLVNKKTTNPV